MKLISSLTLVSKATFCQYRYPYNINREENTNYLQKVQKAQQDLQQAAKRSQIPRRKRRVFDRPKHDLNTAGYNAWRIYDPQQMLFKYWAHGAQVVAKLKLQPKWVIHAFGMGIPPINHEKSASLQFSFEDCHLSKFLLYEYRNTTTFAPNVPQYDYEHQDHLPKRQHKTKRMLPEQFWNSQQHFEFRLNCSDYAQKFKFKQWVIETVQASKTTQSYDTFIEKKYGAMITYNSKADRQHFQPSRPAVLNVTPQHYGELKKGQKLNEPKVQLAKQLGEEHRILDNKTQAIKEDTKKAENIS